MSHQTSSCDMTFSYIWKWYSQSEPNTLDVKNGLGQAIETHVAYIKCKTKCNSTKWERSFGRCLYRRLPGAPYKAEGGAERGRGSRRHRGSNNWKASDMRDMTWVKSYPRLPYQVNTKIWPIILKHSWHTHIDLYIVQLYYWIYSNMMYQGR